MPLKDLLKGTKDHRTIGNQGETSQNIMKLQRNLRISDFSVFLVFFVFSVFSTQKETAVSQCSCALFTQVLTGLMTRFHLS